MSAVPHRLLAGLLLATLAQAPARAQTYTLEEALQDALIRHPKVAARQSDIRSSRSDVDNAGWQRFPSLSVAGSADESGKPVTLTRIQQPLWTWGRIDAAIDTANARLSAAEADLEATRQDVMIKTSDAYWAVLRAQGRRLAAARNLQEHQRLFELIQRRVRSEVNPATDELLASARLQQAQAEQVQYDAELRDALAALDTLVGRGPAALQLSSSAPPLPVLASLEAAQTQALAASPLLAKAEAEADAARAAVRTRQAQMLPQVVARYDHAWGSNRNTSSLFVALEYQPGAGLSAVSAVESGRNRVAASQANAESAVLDVRERIRADWNQAASLQSQLTYLNELARSNSDIAEAYTRQYAAGRKTWSEVMNAHRDASQASIQLSDAQVALLQTRTRLALLTAGWPSVSAAATETPSSRP